MLEKSMRLSVKLACLILLGSIWTCWADIPQLEQAASSVKTGDLQQAESLYNSVITSYPATDYALEAQKQLVILYIQQGRTADASAQINSLSNTYSSSRNLTSAIYVIGNQYEKSSLYEQAKTQYQSIITAEPNSFLAKKAALALVRATALKSIDANDFQSANNTYNSIVTQFAALPDFSASLCQIADKYLQKARYSNAETVYQKVVNDFPATPFAVMAQRQIVLSKILQQDFSAAQTAFNSLLQNSSNSPALDQSLQVIALKYEQVQRYEDAKAAFQQLVTRCGNSTYAAGAANEITKLDMTIQRQSIIDKINQQDYQQAQILFNSFLLNFANNPALDQALQAVALKYQQVKRFDDAKAAYQQLVTRCSASSYAAKAAEEIVKLDFRIKCDAAAALENSNQISAAENVYRQMIAASPSTIYALDAQRQLVMLNIRHGSYGQAQVEFDKLVKEYSNSPSMPSAILDIAAAYNNYNLFQKAISTYQYFLQNYSNSPLAAKVGDELANIEKKYLAATALDYENQSSYDNAIATYQQLVQKYPLSDYAILAQKKIAALDIMAGRYDAAAADVNKLKTVFANDPRFVDAFYYIAKNGYEWQARRYNDAVAIYQEIIQKYPGSSYADMSVINIRRCQLLPFIDAGQDSQALTEIDRLIADFNSSAYLPAAVSRIAEQYQRKAFEFKELGQTDHANYCFQKTIDICQKVINNIHHTSDTALAYSYAGDSARRLERYQDSINYFQKIVDDYPNFHLAGNALYLIARNYEDLKSAGTITESDADVKIKAAYEQLIAKYPSCNAVNVARSWLSYHSN